MTLLASEGLGATPVCKKAFNFCGYAQQLFIDIILLQVINTGREVAVCLSRSVLSGILPNASMVLWGVAVVARLRPLQRYTASSASLVRQATRLLASRTASGVKDGRDPEERRLEHGEK